MRDRRHQARAFTGLLACTICQYDEDMRLACREVHQVRTRRPPPTAGTAVEIRSRAAGPQERLRRRAIGSRQRGKRAAATRAEISVRSGSRCHPAASPSSRAEQPWDGVRRALGRSGAQKQTETNSSRLFSPWPSGAEITSASLSVVAIMLSGIRFLPSGLLPSALPLYGGLSADHSAILNVLSRPRLERGRAS